MIYYPPIKLSIASWKSSLFVPIGNTLPKTNVEPEKDLLEKEKASPKHQFSGLQPLVFRGYISSSDGGGHFSAGFLGRIAFFSEA